MDNKKDMQETIMVRDLAFSIAKSMEFSSPKNEAEHLTILVSGIVLYLCKWLESRNYGKSVRHGVLKTFSGGVERAVKLVIKLEEESDVNDEDVN